jgi:hypothetical protein
MDNWSWINEVCQNVVGVGVMVLWGVLEAIATTTPDISVPAEVNVAALATMAFYGFKVYQAAKNKKTKTTDTTETK